MASRATAIASRVRLLKMGLVVQTPTADAMRENPQGPIVLCVGRGGNGPDCWILCVLPDLGVT
jgi:hypothetical protein